MPGPLVEHDVVVIGAGPTGLAAALELRRLGVPATLVDRLDRPHRQSRATGVLPWSLELLEASGATGAIVDQATHATGADVHAPDGTVLGGYRFDAVPSVYRWFAALPQWRTETVLTERLEAHGGSVSRGITVTGLAEADDHVALQVRHDDGREEDWRARWVISATGPDATVRHALHEQLVGGDYPRRYLVADVAVDADLDPCRTAVFVGDAGNVALLVLPEGRRLVVIDTGKPHGAPAPGLDEVRAHVDERITMRHALSDLVWSSCFTLHHRVAPRMSSDRIFLAGDAAHISSLFGAFGMNGGFQDSVNIAWKIARVRSGRSRAALLDTYHAERHADAARRVAMADAMHTAIAGVGAERRESGASAMPSDPGEANLARCMLDVRYPAGPDIARDAGHRFAHPDRVVRDVGYGLFVEPGTDPHDALLDRWRDTITYVDVETQDAGAALVRPDGIVGWSVDSVTDRRWAELDDRLGALHVPRP